MLNPDPNKFWLYMLILGVVIFLEAWLFWHGVHPRLKH